MTDAAVIPVVDSGVTQQISGANLKTYFTGSYGNANVVANLAALGSNPITTTGNVTAGNLDAVNLVINRISSDDSSFVTVEDGVNVTGEIAATGNITGGNLLTGGVVSFDGGSRLSPLGANLDIFAGAGAYVNLSTSDESSRMGVDNSGGYIVTAGGTWGFGTTGAFTAPGNISAVGNITGGNISATGNVTAANLPTKFAGSWSVPTGNSTQSFTVDSNNTYQMWVEGNIPNGIIAWNALVTVTNNNVPVLGQQFAWNYEGGGNVLMFNSIPDQIIGTAGAISNAEPVVSNTNTFSFGINNSSGNTVTVDYGWVKLS